MARLDASSLWARALDGTEYMPGMVGLNNMKANDYVNVVLQALWRVHPLRDFFLRPANYAQAASPVVQRFGELTRKAWNPRAFKGHVSPHEFMQAVMAASKRRFSIDAQADPVDFLSWLANTLHAELTGGRRRRRSVVTDCLQGEMEVTTLAGSGSARDSARDVTEAVPFLLLALDLPPAPLFKDALEKVTIPQVPVFQLLRKYDGAGVADDVRAGRRRFRVTRLPPFLVLHVKRFVKNQFFVEKNPTIVNFPVKSLDLAACIPLPEGEPRGERGRPRGAVHPRRRTRLAGAWLGERTCRRNAPANSWNGAIVFGWDILSPPAPVDPPISPPFRRGKSPPGVQAPRGATTWWPTLSTRARPGRAATAPTCSGAARGCGTRCRT